MIGDYIELSPEVGGFDKKSLLVPIPLEVLQTALELGALEGGIVRIIAQRPMGNLDFSWYITTVNGRDVPSYEFKQRNQARNGSLPIITQEALQEAISMTQEGQFVIGFAILQKRLPDGGVENLIRNEAVKAQEAILVPYTKEQYLAFDSTAEEYINS